jgi:hypothetical protein
MGVPSSCPNRLHELGARDKAVCERGTASRSPSRAWRSSSVAGPGSDGVNAARGMAVRRSFVVLSCRGWAGMMRTRASASHGS